MTYEIRDFPCVIICTLTALKIYWSWTTKEKKEKKILPTHADCSLKHVHPKLWTMTFVLWQQNSNILVFLALCCCIWSSNKRLSSHVPRKSEQSVFDYKPPQRELQLTGIVLLEVSIRLEWIQKQTQNSQLFSSEMVYRRKNTWSPTQKADPLSRSSADWINSLIQMCTGLHQQWSWDPLGSAILWGSKTFFITTSVIIITPRVPTTYLHVVRQQLQ